MADLRPSTLPINIPHYSYDCYLTRVKEKQITHADTDVFSYLISLWRVLFGNLLAMLLMCGAYVCARASCAAAACLLATINIVLNLIILRRYILDLVD